MNLKECYAESSKKKKTWDGKYNAIQNKLRAKQKIVSFDGWLMSFFNYPNLVQNKPYKKNAEVTRWRGDDYENGEKVSLRINKDSKGIDVQFECGFQPNAFNIFKIGTIKDPNTGFSEMDEYRYAYSQVKKNNPYGIDVYSKN